VVTQILGGSKSGGSSGTHCCWVLTARTTIDDNKLATALGSCTNISLVRSCILLVSFFPLSGVYGGTHELCTS
jgi:hypothetical protein